MRVKSDSSSTLKKLYYFGSTIFCLLLFLCSISAKAVVIDFDDLEYVYGPEDFFGDHPVKNEYQEQGLLIDGGFLGLWENLDDPIVSAPNYLLAGNQLKFKFIGELPTFVSMYVSATFEQAVFLEAFDTLGLFAVHQTDGWAGSENDPLYVPNQLVSFASPTGISEISMRAFYNTRVGAIIDDLTFTYATQVPEPGSVFLFSLGILAIFTRAYAVRSKDTDRISV